MLVSELVPQVSIVYCCNETNMSHYEGNYIADILSEIIQVYLHQYQNSYQRLILKNDNSICWCREILRCTKITAAGYESYSIRVMSPILSWLWVLSCTVMSRKKFCCHITNMLCAILTLPNYIGHYQWHNDIKSPMT